MTALQSDASTFAADMLTGFEAANSQYVKAVDGGVVRSTVIPDGRVGLVVGGGSGHYPAFAGLVGPGLAAGAVCGNIFASPSASQISRIARTVHRGAGVLLGYGNYAGDVLHFGLAQEQLRAAGMDVRSIAVTDDIASAPRDELHKRRGIAGDLTVFKVAGAAAEAGHTLDDVERIARPGQPPHPEPGRRVLRLHPARRHQAAVHRARGHDGGGNGHPRRAGHLRSTPAYRR